ncbi:MAG: hypothetical protein GBAus27B_000284 [Mycoplasmataceae bacterium]|nr:MAG: hypothetical protein GBAus27B_000284 [Mycoplasmataceae bacterium]
MNEEKEYLIGSVINQQKKKVYNKDSQFNGQIYYKLTIGNFSQQHTLFAYANLLKENLWKIIELKNYQSSYLFTTQKTKKRLILLDFKERS